MSTSQLAVRAATEKVTEELDLGPRYAAARAAGAPLSPYEQRNKGSLLKSGSAATAAATTMSNKEYIESLAKLSEEYRQGGYEDPMGKATEMMQTRLTAQSIKPEPEAPDQIFRGTKMVDGKEVPYFFNIKAAQQAGTDTAGFAEKKGVKGVSLLGGEPVSGVMSEEEQRKERLIPAHDSVRTSQQTTVPDEAEQAAQGITVESPTKSPGDPMQTYTPPPPAYDPARTIPASSTVGRQLSTREMVKKNKGAADWGDLFRRILGTETQDLTEYGIF